MQGRADPAPITGQLTLEGIPVLGMVDTGASVICMGFNIWWSYRAQWGALKPFEGTVHGAHGKPLQISGKTQHLDLQWGEARGRASFIVIVGLESPPCLIGMDIMRPLRVHIDVTNGTATPAQPNPQTVHLNAAQSQPQQTSEPSPLTAGPPPASKPLEETPSPGASLLPGGTAEPSLTQPQRQKIPLSGAGSLVLPPPEIPPPAIATPSEASLSAPLSPAPPCSANPYTASYARLLQTADIPPESARLVRCHNPWPTEDVLFCPSDTLPALVTGIPALSSGSELWIAVHNHRPEPLQLHSGQNIGVLEVVTLADTPTTSPTHPKKSCQPPLPECLSPLQQQQLNELFHEFSDVFNRGEDDLGNTPLLEHAIETHGPPLRQPYRRQNPAVRRVEMAQVQQMLSNNVIRPLNSPWASPVVMARKKDGSLRFCVDFRQFNAATTKDAHPLPRIDDLLDALHGAKWFSTLDLKSGYWQVPITEQDKAKTTFRTSSGQLFEFNQVPFGLCNAPATFSCLMDRVLAGLHWETCLFYLDDIIVFSSTWEEHLTRLRQVFKRLRHANLKLGADKCTFAAKEVNYLVHRVTEEGLLPDPSLLAAIRDIPPPKTPTEVRSFLGLAGYYWRYVKGFAAIAAPLLALTRKDTVFHWSEDCQTAFDRLKTLLTTSPITAFPDFSQAFCLYTDASTAGLGAILAQVWDGKERIICCASRALNQAEKAYPATKLECLALVWAVAKFRSYLMAMPFEVFTDHYALQWLKTMCTGSALLHRWSAALEEYDFTVHHRPGKVQTHVDRLSRLPVSPAPPEDTLLHVQVDTEEEVRRLTQELHTAMHLGGQALWKLFSDRYSHKAGRRICIEVAHSCPQCQLGSDYRHRLKTTGSIQSKGPWDTLSVDIVGPLPANCRHEFLIVFVDCYSRYTILVPASNHTASMVSDALLRHVLPYFGTPRRLLSDRGREFVGEVWAKLTLSLGIQRLLTSPYHPEGNSINELSHRTINNMLRARLLDGVPSRTWVDKIPGIMLALNAMVHEPHYFSASMIATGREPTLPPDLESDACASPALEDPTSYMEAIKQRLTLTHQQMTPPPAPVTTNPYREGSLIFAMTTPPERTSKLAPRWKGPFVVKRVPNPYQVTYEDGSAWRTIHINHAKPDKAPADGFPAPIPTPEPPKPTLGYLPRSLQRPLSRRPLPPPPHEAATPAGGSPAAAPAAPTAATPPSSRRSACIATNRNSAPRAAPPPPTAPERTNENLRLRRSACLTPKACVIKSHLLSAAPQSHIDIAMARTYPLSLAYNQCLGSKEDPYSFSSLYLEDLQTGKKECLVNIRQLVDALPKAADPTSRLALRGQVTLAGQPCLRHSMRAALWWLLPSDRDFRRTSKVIHFYLAHQGRCVVLRGGNITQPFYESRLRWLPDATPPSPPRAMDCSETPAITPSDSVRPRVFPMENTETSATQATAIADSALPGAPLAMLPTKKCRRRRRRNALQAANENSAPCSAAPVTKDERWANRNSASPRATQHHPEASDPAQISSTSVYCRPSIHSQISPQPPNSTANRNSAFDLGLECRGSVGLYKPAFPDPSQDSAARPLRVNNSGSGLSSLPHLQPYTKPFSGRPARPRMTCPTREAGDAVRQRSGIVYPLLPHAQRPDTHIAIDAALPEAAALGRQDLPPTVLEIGNTSQPEPEPSTRRRASKKPSRKRRRSRSAGVFRPPKRSPSCGHWCE